jgi:GAF domain-containing protein/multidrug resistance efflux pump
MSGTLQTALESLDASHLRRLIAVSHAFNSTIDIHALLPRVLDLVLETMDAEAGSLWLVEGEVIRCHVAQGATGTVLTGLELPIGAGVAGLAVAERQTIHLEEVRDDPRFLHQVDEAANFETQSVIAVPLIALGEVIGAIEVVNDRTDDGVFAAHHRGFLEALADDAAAAIRNAKLFHAERQARDLAALLEVTHEITSTFDRDRVLLSVVNLAGKAVRFDRCVLALWEEQRLRVRAISAVEQIDQKAAEVRELERFLHWAAESGEPRWVPDVLAEGSELARVVREEFPAYLSGSRARGVLVLPIADAEGPLGAMLFEFTGPDQLSEWGREAASLLANTTALALRNAQLYADVPFISWLEPLAEKRRALSALPGKVWVRYAAAAAAVLLLLFAVRLPLRLSASEASVRAAIQQPARAGVSGIVDAVWIREGERVERGTPIAQLRDEELAQRWADASAGLGMASAELQAAHARGDAVGAGLARIRADELRQSLDLLRRRLDESRVLAPSAGLVLTSRPEDLVGAFVTAGSPLTWIGEPEWVEVELKMRQEDIGDVREGDRVRAKVNAHPGVTFQGRVSSISPRAERSGEISTYTVRAVLDNREQLLRPGMDARARVITSPRSLAEFLFRRPWRWMRMWLWW